MARLAIRGDTPVEEANIDQAVAVLELVEREQAALETGQAQSC